MSGSLDALKKDADRRQATGFATMHPDPGTPSVFLDTDYASSVSQAFLGPDTAAGCHMVVAYSTRSAPHYVGPFSPDIELEVFGVIRSSDFVVRSTRETATMSLPGVVRMIEPVEQHERGVMILRMPRKVIHTEQVSVVTAALPKKRPHVILSDRTRGEENV